MLKSSFMNAIQCCFVSLLFLISCHQEKTEISNMRVNHLERPLALAESKPHFSWQLISNEDSLLQVAYRLQLLKGDELIWDTDTVIDGRSVGIPYAGTALEAGKAFTWNVTVWDNKGNEITSPDAYFETGLALNNAWEAQWIGKPVSRNEEQMKWNLSLPRWIWYPEPNHPDHNPTGTRFFKKEFVIENLDNIEESAVSFTADDNNKLYINGNLVNESSWLNLQRQNVLNMLNEGVNSIEITASNAYGSAGSLAQLYLLNKNGEFTYYSTGKDWLSSKNKKDWQPSEVIASVGDPGTYAWCNYNFFREKQIMPPTYFRKEFVARDKLIKARLYATAKGIYEMHLNGEKVTDYYFAPGFTDYNKRFLYQAFDVTEHVKNGRNTLGAIVGDGWYAGSIGWGDKRNHYGEYPLFLLAELHLTFADGSTEIISTDQNWKASHGPVVFSDMLDGETYDDRINIEGWNKTGFDDTSWAQVTSTEVEENITADPGVPVQVMDILTPESISEPKPGVYVFDMGQNMVGIAEGTFRGNAGDTITLRFAEMLQKDSMIYTENLRTADATDRYIFGTEEQVSWEPKFTFHGFRYVEVTGLDYKPKKEDFRGKVLYSNIPETGNITSSSDMLNQIVENVKWGQRGNFLNLPTDCPQRDERLGWLGDAQVFVKTSAYNMDVAAFFNKWLLDVRDAQGENGAFPSVAPRIILSDDGSPAWGDAGVIVPWVLYQMYGDPTYLTDNYEPMKEWVAYIHQANPDYLWRNNRNNDFGDWLNTDAITDKELIGTAFFAYSTKLVAKTAKELGESGEHAYYSTLFDSIRNAFQNAYLNDAGELTGDTQTAYVLALQFNLLDAENRVTALKHLADNIAERNNHHSTGFVGIGHLLPVLTEYGHNDLAYTLIMNETFPSLGYMVKNGATTIWERWDGYTEEKGFQDAGMNSFNHYSLGSPTEWLYTHAAGIQPEAPGFKSIMIKPHPAKALGYLNVDFKSPYGNIGSHWKLQGNVLQMEVAIPSNTVATIYVPAKNIETDLAPLEENQNYSVFTVGSGNYTFKGTFAPELYQ